MTPAAARSQLATSPDGQWVAIRRGEAITLLAGGVAPAVGRAELGSDDADLAFVGPPAMVAAVVRNVAPRVMLYQPPSLEVVARHDLDQPMRIAAITGPRLALVSADNKKLVLVRVTQTALAAQTVELDGPVDFVVGLDRNQLLLSIHRKLEVWDATTGRPVLRMQLQLPPPPRSVGAAQGHVWATRPNADDLYLYRLSDGRPFRHLVGAPPIDVIAHPASPIVVIATERGLVRLHCFAHSLMLIDAPWVPGTPIAQLAVGDDVSLLGLADGEPQPWHVPIAGAGAPAIPPPPVEEPAPPAEHDRAPAVVRFRSLREKHEAERGAAAPSSPSSTPVAAAPPAPLAAPLAAPPAAPPAAPLVAPPATPATPPATAAAPAPAIFAESSGAKHPRAATAPPWREVLARIGAELVQGGTPDLAAPIDDSELAELADRLLLSKRSLRALIALYGLYLVGEPELSIADLAHLLGDWTEPLGTGELGAFGMLHRERGRVSLSAAVTDLLDGCAPRAVRLVGATPGKPRAGAWRYAREGKSDAVLETLLATKLGRLAIVEDDPDRALLEARLHGATAIAFHPPAYKPRPWPRDAGLVLVLYGSATSWIADLPSLD